MGIEVGPELCAIVLECDRFAERVLVKLLGCKSLRLVQVASLDESAVLANEFAAVLGHEATTHQVSVGAAVSNADQLVATVPVHLLQVRPCVDLLGQDLLHDPIAILRLRQLFQLR